MNSAVFSKIAVCNTGPLIALHSIQHLHLLSQLFDQVIIPNEVEVEFTAGLVRPKQKELQSIGLIYSLQLPLDPLLTSVLDLGEASVIQSALEENQKTVIIDEKKARRIARSIYKLDVVGTVGILIEAKRKGIIPTVKPLIEQMKNKGYWIHPDIVCKALPIVGEC